MLSTPSTSMVRRSSPSPAPACGAAPYSNACRRFSANQYVNRSRPLVKSLRLLSYHLYICLERRRVKTALGHTRCQQCCVVYALPAAANFLSHLEIFIAGSTSHTRAQTRSTRSTLLSLSRNSPAPRTPFSCPCPLFLGTSQIRSTWAQTSNSKPLSGRLTQVEGGSLCSLPATSLPHLSPTCHPYRIFSV